MNTAGADPAMARVVELRQYTLRPGQREVLIELFERELIEPQEAVGMQILGQFRDLDRPDRFVWLRGFSDMESRAAGAHRFLWRSGVGSMGSAANATMIDSDDVLLLRPAAQPAGSGRTCILDLPLGPSPTQVSYTPRSSPSTRQRHRRWRAN